MTYLKHLICGAAIALAANTASQAQMMDMSKFTCAQLLQGTGNSIEAAIWLSGYYNGVRKNTMFNLDQFSKNADVVIADCKANPKKTVMETVDSMMAAAKK